jgi:hypothetical protein
MSSKLAKLITLLGALTTLAVAVKAFVDEVGAEPKHKLDASITVDGDGKLCSS